MHNHILIAKDIVKQYGDYTALNHVNIEIPEGSIFGLLGPNGAGKTTLMRIINQIIAPDSGTLIFDGNPLKREDIAKIGYGFAPPFNLKPHFNREVWRLPYMN